MEKNTREKIEIMIEAIKNQIDPQKIILFGSFAKGTQKEDSDIDMCVITDHNKRKIEMLRELRLSTIGKIDIPMDIVIYGNTEFSQRAENLNSFESQIASEGVLLYKEVKRNGI
ncbi:MAG: nucleotidyltransferase domain-containing protein [Thermotogota bacterium]|nr:nucleotidyltransferase domain-containing protein [Thermotogota bacterium]